jgi:hypothetical protein
MVKKSDFPKKLYVYIDEDGEEKFFIANDTARGCFSLDQTRLIGIYNLEKTVKLLPAEGLMVAA